LNNPHKQRGAARLWLALGNSARGLRIGLREAAFQQELVAAAVLIPAAFWVGQGWVQVTLLIGVVVLVLIVELLNTAIEATVDRIGLERHPLSGEAKDLGSAAVLLSCLLCGGVWAAAVWARWLA
jgi:diacylglycerol kinase (ATP)